ncbi:MAG TPA: TfoX/Sxy family protein [Solirubrobacteraceae bacterium]|nr:TfoX/Sxy family protein [Solirubrobacteraceae bacterium]
MAGTYEIVAEELQADPAVRTGVMFGHRCLKTGRRMFACEYEGELLVKLPPERRQELEAQGARPFTPMGRPMTGWILVAEPADDAVAAWVDLAEEAKAFVAEAA